ncbi:MAG TPA: hypothetical protein VD902_16010 [Symbiobacteriaceae bacterium]|nr:hypothetical protein [Symbiobacteriaceae bacterium]
MTAGQRNLRRQVEMGKPSRKTRRRQYWWNLGAVMVFLAVVAAVGWPVVLVVTVLPENKHMAMGLLALAGAGWLWSGLAALRGRG